MGEKIKTSKSENLKKFNFEKLPIDIKILILKKVVGADRNELENIKNVHPQWLFITKTNDFMNPIFGQFNHN